MTKNIEATLKTMLTDDDIIQKVTRDFIQNNEEKILLLKEDENGIKLLIKDYIEKLSKMLNLYIEYGVYEAIENHKKLYGE